VLGRRKEEEEEQEGRGRGVEMGREGKGEEGKGEPPGKREREREHVGGGEGSALQHSVHATFLLRLMSSPPNSMLCFVVGPHGDMLEPACSRTESPLRSARLVCATATSVSEHMWIALALLCK